MPIQSYLMMYFAGSGWQYGKRKISAMTNEQFNKLTPQELIKQHTEELKDILPTLEKSLNDVTPLVGVLIEQYGDFVKTALAAVPTAIEKAIPETSLAGQIIHPPTGAGGEPDAWAALANFLAVLTGQLPSLPSADARLGGSKGESLFQRDTIKADAIKQAKLEAERVEKHRKFIEEQKKAKETLKLANDKLSKISSVHQIISGSVMNQGNVKKKAGQTQKKRRLFLIRIIAALAGHLKRNITVKQRTAFKIQLASAQTELTGLLLRYDFS